MPYAYWCCAVTVYRKNNIMWLYLLVPTPPPPHPKLPIYVWLFEFFLSYVYFHISAHLLLIQFYDIEMSRYVYTYAGVVEHIFCRIETLLIFFRTLFRLVWNFSHAFGWPTEYSNLNEILWIVYEMISEPIPISSKQNWNVFEMEAV